jgi:hypothetical protein
VVNIIEINDYPEPMKVLGSCMNGRTPVEEGIKFLTFILDGSRCPDNPDWVDEAYNAVRFLKVIYPIASIRRMRF